MSLSEKLMSNIKLFKVNFLALVFSLVFMFISNKTIGQAIISNAYIAEKIYLQLDKDIYTTGSTIWFKSIVTKSLDNTPTDLSGVLYVELINAEKTIIEKKLIKLDKGIGEGYFDLLDTVKAGNYLIRAYTEWNKNFDADFFFEKYVQVFSTDNENAKENATSNLETKIPEQENDSKTIVNDKNRIDFQFFPESGELVNGLPSKVGFKVLDSYGNGKIIEGTIVDDENNLVTSFKSNALGMGHFILNKVDVKKNYHAKTSNNNLYPLPKIASIGNVLSVIHKENTIILTGISNYMKNDSIYVTASFRGVNVYDFKSILQNGTFRFSIPNDKLPQGIIAFTMLDNNKRKVAERLYFNKRLDNHPHIKISSEKPVYPKRDLTHFSIETTDKNNNPIIANTSVLVLNKQQLGTMQNMRDHIVSYFLMSSELKGTIEKPGFYFNKNTNTENDLDALMLTQGWRQYKYEKPYDKLIFNPEPSLTISGKVIIKQQKDASKETNLTMATYGKDVMLYTQTTDSLGSFKFDLDDEFGENVKVLISSKKNGKRVDSNFFIDEKKSPLIDFEIKKEKGKKETETEVFVEKAIERKKIETDFFIPSESIALDEVLLTGRKLNAAQQKVTNRFGEADIIIDGKELKEKEKSWSSGIFDILHYNFSDKVLVRRDSIGNPSVIALNGMITLFVIDGMTVFGDQLHNLRHIQADQVTSLEVIEFAKFFKRFYAEVYPEKFGPKSPTQGNIVAIYTKEGKGIHGAYARKSKSLGETSIPVFSESKIFYTPKYDEPIPKELYKPDLRSVVHWQPILKTNDAGKAEISFYNADITGDMLVIIEAITENGDVAYEEFIYKVE
jgi:hypothetical protein